jgi:hypothetical protein
MDVRIQTRFSIGDKVRIRRKTNIDRVIECPFCKGVSKYHAEVYREVPQKIGTCYPAEIVLMCQTCQGKGEVALKSTEETIRTVRGIWRITGVESYDVNRGVCYRMRLYDWEGDPDNYPDMELLACEKDLTDISEGVDVIADKPNYRLSRYWQNRLPPREYFTTGITGMALNLKKLVAFARRMDRSINDLTKTEVENESQEEETAE